MNVPGPSCANYGHLLLLFLDQDLYGGRGELRTIFLLGAGASFSAGIPMAVPMTARLAAAPVDPTENLEDSDRLAMDVLSFVVGTLTMQRGINGKFPLNKEYQLDVEEVFSAIELLRDRRSSDCAPFVASWHDHIPELERRSTLATDLAYKAVADTASSEDQKLFLLEVIRNYGTQLNDEHIKSVLQRRNGEAFADTCDVLLYRLSRLVWLCNSEKQKVHYLKAILKSNSDYTCVTTLNYDNTVELAADSNQISWTHGIEHWPHSAITRDNKQLLILKLHGSIDWHFQNVKGKIDRDRIIAGTPYHKLGHKTSAKYYNEPGIVFGRGNKLRPGGPFLDLLNAFRAELDKADHLTVVGYSFRDEHVNIPIKRWLASKQHRRITIISPNAREIEFLKDLEEIVSRQVTIVPEGAESALPRLYGDK